MPQDRTIETVPCEWRGITIEVSYEADWLGMGSRNAEYGHSHLELRVIAPEGAQLPVTETGYRSHFLSCGEVEGCGGPVAYVLDWLDTAAKDKAWITRQESLRQLSLF
jgi:hypothetical protein